MYAEPKRLEFLDSLRGLAALFVLLSHIVLAFAWSGIFSQLPALPFVSICFNGPEAVAMFFVLSGFVLSRPYLSNDPQNASTRKLFLPTFYLRRFIRIWAPWFVAFGLSILAKQYFFYTPITFPPITPWLDQFWHTPLTIGDFARQCLFLSLDGPRKLLNQDWSLAVELKGSLLIPLFIFLSPAKRLPFLALLAVVLVYFFPTGHYYPLFMMGVLAARFENQLVTIFSRRPPALLFATFLGGICLYQALGWSTQIARTSSLANHLGWLISGFGCTLILLTAMASRRFQQFLLHRFLVLLGRISYSVYLLQFIFILCLLPPLVAALNRCHIVQDFILLPVLIVTGFLTTGICALVMYRFIEVPAISLGHILTKKIQCWIKNRR